MIYFRRYWHASNDMMGLLSKLCSFSLGTLLIALTRLNECVSTVLFILQSVDVLDKNWRWINTCNTNMVTIICVMKYKYKKIYIWLWISTFVTSTLYLSYMISIRCDINENLLSLWTRTFQIVDNNIRNAIMNLCIKCQLAMKKASSINKVNDQRKVKMKSAHCTKNVLWGHVKIFLI